MRSTKFIVLIFILTLFSCRKDVALVPENNWGTPVYAGVYDSSYYYFEYSTPLELTVVWDSQNLYGLGADSIDLNNDSLYDCYIEMSLVNSDSSHLITGYPDPFPHLILELNNDLKILSYYKFVYTGGGTGYKLNYVKDLDYGVRVDTLIDYYNYTFNEMWREIPMNISYYSDMYSIHDTTYMALKFDTDKFGWIKVDMTVPKNPKFLSVAVQL